MSAPGPASPDRSHARHRPAAGGSRPHVGPIAVTPFRVVLVVFFLVAMLSIAWAVLKVRDSSQIPMVTAGLGVMGLVFAAASAGAAVRMWQSWRDGLQGETLFFALFGGIAGMAALGCFAGTLVLTLVWAR